MGIISNGRWAISAHRKSGDDVIVVTPDEFVKRIQKFLAPETGAKNEAAPAEFSLQQNYPNPFNPNTTIHFSLPRASHITLKIYNSKGQEIKTLVDRNVGAGLHHATWDGRAHWGDSVTNGFYVYRLESDFGVEAKKMILMK